MNGVNQGFDGTLLDMLGVGINNARTAKEISDLWGCKDVRTVRGEIARLKKAGAVICASSEPGHSGYFLPASIEDIRFYCRLTRHRVAEILEALRPAEDFVARYDGRL